jgi:hypothetical protein
MAGFYDFGGEFGKVIGDNVKYLFINQFGKLVYLTCT